MKNKKPCPLCGTSATYQADYSSGTIFYSCPTCGRFEFCIHDSDIDFNFNHLASYLLYHKYKNSFSKIEYRYHTTASKEICDKYNQEFEKGNNIQGRPVHMDNSIVKA